KNAAAPWATKAGGETGFGEGPGPPTRSRARLESSVDTPSAIVAANTARPSQPTTLACPTAKTSQTVTAINAAATGKPISTTDFRSVLVRAGSAHRPRTTIPMRTVTNSTRMAATSTAVRQRP